MVMDLPLRIILLNIKITDKYVRFQRELNSIEICYQNLLKIYGMVIKIYDMVIFVLLY